MPDFVTPIIERWRVLLVFALFGAVLGFGFSKITPKTYQASASIFIQGSQHGSSLLRDLPIALPSAGSDSTYYVALLKSESLMRNVIIRLHLLQEESLTHSRPVSEDEMLVKLGKLVSVKDDKSGGIIITATSRKPQLAADICNSMLFSLDKMVVRTSARKADFISRKLDETSSDLRLTENKLLLFSQKHDVTEIEEQTRQFIIRYGDLESRLISLNAQLQELDSELKNAGELDTLVELEVRRKSIAASRDYVLKQKDAMHAKLAGLPALAATYSRLQRNVATLTKTYGMLTEQYQLARITQQGEDGDYQIIDTAHPKKKPVGPSTTANTALGGILGLALAAVAVNMGGRRLKVRPRRAPAIKV